MPHDEVVPGMWHEKRILTGVPDEAQAATFTTSTAGATYAYIAAYPPDAAESYTLPDIKIPRKGIIQRLLKAIRKGG